MKNFFFNFENKTQLLKSSKMNSVQQNAITESEKKRSFGKLVTATELNAFHRNGANSQTTKSMAETKKEQIFDAYVIEGVVDARTFFVPDGNWIGTKPAETDFDLYFVEGYMPDFNNPKINVKLRKIGQFRGYPINKINTDNYGIKTFNKIEKYSGICDSKIINPYYK